MKFLLDENVDSRLAAFLREQGHDVTVIAQEYPYSLADREMLAIAHRDGRTLITNDHDFGELIVLHHLPHAGVILLRLGSEQLTATTAALARLLTDHADRLDQFVVVTDHGVRVRRVA